LYSREENFLKNYNNEMIDNIKSDLDFIIFHYLGKRKDTKFWKNFKKNNEITENVKKIYNLWNNNVPKVKDLFDKKIEKFNHFPYYTWYTYAMFTQNISIESLSNFVEKNNLNQYKEKRNILKNLQKEVASNCIDHDEFLEIVKKNNVKFI